MSDGPGRKPTVSDDEILDVFRDATDPVLTASEVADQFPLGRRAIFKRLRDLADRGVVESKETGSGGRVWWLPGHTTTEENPPSQK
ncbi:hypothetical protein BRC64_05735 [Halobacteriales archaeon QH_10_67_22]|nr:MAG: hypothetical protein BRC64_05735 [Halobacteriales archaeon QH_10_67_22]